MRTLLALAVVLTPLSLAAGPEHCPDALAQWTVGRGELWPATSCGAFFLSTDSEDHASSMGEASFRREVKVPFEASLRWRRLGPEAGKQLWIKLPGGHLLFKDGAVGLWISHAQFAASGFHALPGVMLHDEHLVTVRQSRDAVELRIDGGAPLVLPVAGPRGGKVAIGLEGARGYRSLMTFREFSVREL
ncbi:MAG: hypothetical protein JST92_02400 [Deltaproteobacteria bacterium]|nr:hypothetical protein [Deltaproteobacteria bacterium]